ncbi:type VII secretion integral membrane protein EccD [Polymorphospora lycopeni]|uniref:Type VII secretion integral membrane protein EccD n=1 Tax=Polymorphospora lycopeni TaxID=3140240 RepID=A0ABV5CXT8_9ACTN
MSTGLARVTVSTPRRRVDVAVPDRLPLAELLPELLRHAGEGLADDGERHGGWVLRRTDGAPLTAGQGLQPQGVRDGEVLHLVPARAQWPELEYDDVVEVIADAARRGGGWSARATRTATVAGAGVPLAVGLLTLVLAGPGWPVGAYAGLAAAVLLTLAGTVASRAYGDAVGGAALGGFAMLYGFTGGALLVASGDPVGLPGPLRWLGGPELLAASVALLVVAVFGLAGVAAVERVFAAGVLVGALGTATATADLFLPAAGAAAILTVLLVCGIGVLPLLAIRLGRLPMPPVTLPSGTDSADGVDGFPATDAAPDRAGTGPDRTDAARERPDRRLVHSAVARTEELLAGMLVGHALLTVAAATVLVTAGWAGRSLVAVAAAALLLRSRLFATRAQRTALVAAGLAGFGVLGAALAADGDPAVGFAVLVGGLPLALLTVVAGATYARRPPSPYLGRAADLLDTATVLSLVPVACAVLGLYTQARDLLG